jgi:hypothetical protein
VFIVLAIVQFGASGCDLAIAEISWTCIGCALFSYLSISGINDNGSLLCSSVMTLYCSFYCWSALSGMSSDFKDDSGANCNTLLTSSGSPATIVNVVFGMVLTCLSLFGAAYYGGAGADEMTIHGNGTPMEVEQGAPAESGGNYTQMGTEEAQDWGDTSVIQRFMTFHFIMVVCTMFMTLTIVNWSTNVTGEKATLQDFGTGTAVVWVKMLSQWLAMLLYAWTIIAPRVFEACGAERDFEFS